MISHDAGAHDERSTWPPGSKRRRARRGESYAERYADVVLQAVWPV